MTLREQFLNGDGCTVIDAHGHLGPFAGIYLPEASLDSMVMGLKDSGIEAIILSPHSALCGDTRQGNREMIDAVEKFPGLIYGYCTINPNFPGDIENEMDSYLGHPGVVGIKLHPAIHSTAVTSYKYESLWKRANRDRLMVLCHTWGETGGFGAQDMKKIAELYPDLRLLLGHSCYGAWEEAIALARDFKNVYLELTACYPFYGLLETMCEQAGSTKVLFGTDYPWFDYMHAIGCVVHAHISEDDMRNILALNARRLLDEQCSENQLSG